MTEISSVSFLPDALVARFNAWRQDDFDATHFAELANGQSPIAMVISCCDSRVQSTEIFDVPAGSFFIHRNIANLVPPYEPGDDAHGTASALEYAVKALKVPHLIIMGHSAGFEFVGHWLEILRSAHGRISGTEEAARLISMGHQGVIGSLDNLMGYPFVAEAVEAGALSLHGLWHDIGPGALYALNPESGAFEAL